jgi:diaminohydroxyphosphoribosylaminopyrimidine deaminase / 5-amino-6-(5-phosphoribosylamino)uracil reductase
VVTSASLDERYMRRALFHAARGQGRTTPNPMVGAVVVSRDGVLVGQGFHERAGEPHAEVHALNAAGDRARDATLYVTLEPCSHTGRTGPCTDRIIDAGIARVVAAMRDPDPRVSGTGFATLRAHGIRVDVGLCEDDAARLNDAFVTAKTRGRPLVVLKAALSLDAAVAARRGARTPITSREANQKAHVLRASVDAIAVGSGTVLVDDPVLTARVCHRARPLLRVIFDRRLRTPPAARVFSTLNHGPVIIMTNDARGAAAPRAAALERAGAEIVEAATLDAALQGLLGRDVSTLLVEGGPVLHRAFVTAALVDRLHLIIAPHALGADAVKWLDVQALVLPPGAALTAEPRGTDIWIEADVHRHS